MKEKCLSIIIPVYNEERTLKDVVIEVSNANICGLKKEIVIVDDDSTDSSLAIAKSLSDQVPGVKILTHSHNMGKGAALSTGFKNASGDIIAIQDADLEYTPREYDALVRLIIEGQADVVYGSRFLSGLPHRILFFWHSLGNYFLTFTSNMFSDLNLSDMETCYKAFRRELIDDLTIEEKRFGVEPELTAKFANMARERHIRIYEVGISYSGRTYHEGKKIGWKDAISALRCIVKYNNAWPARLFKYLCSGSIIAVSQLASMAILVYLFQAEANFSQILCYLFSIELSILSGFFLHKKFTWRMQSLAKSQTPLELFKKYHIVTFNNVIIRVFLFYILMNFGVHYLLNSLIGILSVIVLNFIGYDKLVFKREKWEYIMKEDSSATESERKAS